MIRLIVSSMCILTLVIGIGYLSPNSPSKILTAHIDGGLVLLAAADESTEAGGDEKGEKSEDEVPGIDRIACSVCYG
jgi:hypothetical protein